MTKSQAGRLGGKSTFKKYGKTHMKTIGKKGAEKTWSLYSMKPVGQSHYAMVRKSDGIIISTNYYNPWRM